GHVALVFLTHVGHNATNMVFGSYDPARVAQAVTIMIATIGVVVAVWIALSYLTLVDRRRSQRILVALTEPLRAWTINKFKPRYHAKKPYTEKDISPYHWTNGRFPTLEESPEWHILAKNDFDDYVLQIGGDADDATFV